MTRDELYHFVMDADGTVRQNPRYVEPVRGGNVQPFGVELARVERDTHRAVARTPLLASRARGAHVSHSAHGVRAHWLRTVWGVVLFVVGGERQERFVAHVLDREVSA